jgi:hypothetical protein
MQITAKKIIEDIENKKLTIKKRHCGVTLMYCFDVLTKDNYLVCSYQIMAFYRLNNTYLYIDTMLDVIALHDTKNGRISINVVNGYKVHFAHTNYMKEDEKRLLVNYLKKRKECYVDFEVEGDRFEAELEAI